MIYLVESGVKVCVTARSCHSLASKMQRVDRVRQVKIKKKGAEVVLTKRTLVPALQAIIQAADLLWYPGKQFILETIES